VLRVSCDHLDGSGRTAGIGGTARLSMLISQERACCYKLQLSDHRLFTWHARTRAAIDGSAPSRPSPASFAWRDDNGCAGVGGVPEAASDWAVTPVNCERLFNGTASKSSLSLRQFGVSSQPGRRE
jgi:hypothetical protein